MNVGRIITSKTPCYRFSEDAITQGVNKVFSRIENLSDVSEVKAKGAVGRVVLSNGSELKFSRGLYRAIVDTLEANGRQAKRVFTSIFQPPGSIPSTYLDAASSGCNARCPNWY